MNTNATSVPSRCEVVVVGTGAGGLVAALAAARRGLDVVVIEREPHFGGTTAYSGSGIWLPGNSVSLGAGAVDDVEATREYLDAVVDESGNRELREAYLTAAAPTVDELLEERWIELEWKPFPDYFPEVATASQRGRSIYPLPITRPVAAAVADTVIPTLPVTRGGHDTGETMIGGQALTARLLLALADRSVPVFASTELIELHRDGDRVDAVVVRTADGERRIEVERGVILASGGFEQNIELRLQHGHPVKAGWTMGAPGGRGGALAAATAIGAATDLMDACWWTPAFATEDGPAFRVRDRGRPGSIMVDRAGRRFVNESLPYDRVGGAMAALCRSGQLELPAWFIIDQTFLDRYGINGVPAGETLPAAWFEGGWCHQADSVEALAATIGVDADGLVATVDDHNQACETGIDPFGRGEHAFDRFFGDPEVGPNPTLAPITKSPFYALPVVLSDLGTKGGLVCDTAARVLDTSGSVIGGLYATGNAMAPWSGKVYPGPGVPIGTSIVFGRLAAIDIAAASAPHGAGR
ncbi:MAG TPA: FAD-dependent oxidoreductase [Ilumatobacteraceae bacterium]|nr:FAD-dependent oxidoreductase [Ilumatobacteraceae bacterium]